MKTVFEVAAADGRDYITPEDVTTSRESGCPPDRVRVHVLQAMVGKPGDRPAGGYWGIEDKGMVCWSALEDDDR